MCVWISSLGMRRGVHGACGSALAEAPADADAAGELFERSSPRRGTSSTRPTASAATAERATQSCALGMGLPLLRERPRGYSNPRGGLMKDGALLAEAIDHLRNF